VEWTGWLPSTPGRATAGQQHEHGGPAPSASREGRLKCSSVAPLYTGAGSILQVPGRQPSRSRAGRARAGARMRQWRAWRIWSPFPVPIASRRPPAPVPDDRVESVECVVAVVPDSWPGASPSSVGSIPSIEVVTHCALWRLLSRPRRDATRDLGRYTTRVIGACFCSWPYVLVNAAEVLARGELPERSGPVSSLRRSR